MAEWRPEDWFDTVHHRPEDESDDGVYESDWDDGYEAGADAIVAALKKSLHAVRKGRGSLLFLAEYVDKFEGPGTLVFIPDAPPPARLQVDE